MADEKKYTGYGYHGGGRKATGVKRVSICISGQPEQIEKLKKMAAQEGKTVSAFILEKTGVMKKNGGNNGRASFFICRNAGKRTGRKLGGHERQGRIKNEIYSKR